MPEESDPLRENVKRLKKAVTRKVSRIKVNQGIFISGSHVDPRKSAATEKHMSPPQLREYTHALSAFLDRGNQFVPDSQRRPMPRSEWNSYKALENQWNSRVRSHMENINSIRLPDGMTVAQRDAAMRPNHPQMSNPSVNGPREIDRSPTAIAGTSRLRSLTDQMRKRLDENYFDELIKSGKETFSKMLDVIGDDDLESEIRTLSPKQFEVLWNWTPFATALSFQYELAMKELSARDKETWAGTVQHHAVREARNYVEWAKGLHFPG
jgi:hypothetical protein